jgi:murein L,D-transpeptidase YcbB/YkuD
LRYKSVYRTLLLIISASLILQFNACKKKTEEEVGLPVKIILPGLDPAKLTQLIIAKVSDTLYRPEGIYDVRFEDTLKKFYIQRDGNPVWINFIQDTGFRRELKFLITSVIDHGLQEKFYNKNLIFNKLQEFDSLKKISSDKDYHLLSDLDYLISMSIISLYKDLSLGRIDPFKFYKPFYSVPLSKSIGFKIFSVLQHPGSFHDTITMRTPCSRRYHALQTIWKRHNEYLRFKPAQNLDTTGDIYSITNKEIINHRMALLWYSIDNKLILGNNFIESNREDYIRKTRNIFGLSTGSLDSVLVSRLCVPVIEVSDDILVSLERERWFSAPDTGTYVMVHLNEFMVYMQNDSVNSMKVCVGKAKASNFAAKYREYLKTKNHRLRPIDSETPQIGSSVTEVILNPTWTVPNSIIGKEMYSQIVSNPNYLTRKGYEVLQNGKVVSPSSINWKGFKPYGVTVKIRQKAGPSNSLGTLKFNFPNPHNIYMHDTPEKGKFSQSNRSVSHGCIRLNYPVKMAEFLLGLQGDSALVDKFRLKMGLQPYDTSLQMADSLLKPIKETERIRLKRTVPVYLVYKTIYIERNGEIRFAKDIYRKNQVLAKNLRG